MEPSFADYRAHADPALDEALTGRFVSLEDALGEALPHGYPAMLAAYRSWTRDARHRYVTNAEARVNALGYKLLNDKRGDDAIVAFRVNVDTHPKSANAFDSLGEAYDLTGRKDDAIAAYEQSVKLNPTSPSGLTALARMPLSGRPREGCERSAAQRRRRRDSASTHSAPHPSHRAQRSASSPRSNVRRCARARR